MADPSAENDYDAAARFLMKLDAQGFLDWALPNHDQDLRFERWLETQSSGSPEEQEKRTDNVMELVSDSGGQASWAIIFESETSPVSGLVLRVLEYQCRLLRELRHGPYGQDSYQMGVAVLILTGPAPRSQLLMELPGEPEMKLEYSFKPITLTTMSAAETIQRIANGELRLSVLPWVVLMEGSGDEELIEEWIRLGLTETDRIKQRTYGAIAGIFSQKTDHEDLWKSKLKEWNVQHTPVVQEWIDQGIQKGLEQGREQGAEHLRAKLLKYFARFPDPVPEALAKQIAETNSLDQLDKWFDAALESESMTEFQSKMTQ